MDNICTMAVTEHRHFAALDDRVIIGYYVDTIHDMESVTDPYVEITEELWLALNENSVRNEFIDSSDIDYDKIYTINDLELFQETPAMDVEVPPTPTEQAIEDLQFGLQETNTNLDNLQTEVATKSDTVLLTTAEYEALEANGELNENTIYMLTDDTEEEDLIALVNSMNNIDYDAFLAFDTSEIV